MDNYIRRVRIDSLFEDNNDYIIDFVEDVNCIFGENGSGKTTVINLIVATLNCDLKSLNKIPFKSIEILTATIGTRRAIKAISLEKLDNEELLFVIYPEDISENLNMLSDQREITIKKSKIVNALNQLLMLTYVPLNRLSYNDTGLDNPDEFLLNRALRARHLHNDEILKITDPSRRMLSSIEKEFIEKFSSIQEKIQEDSEEMKHNIVRRTLIDDEFLKKSDDFSLKIHTQSNLASEEYNPKEVLKKFKNANIDISSTHLENHFRLWSKVTNEFELSSKQYDKDDSNSVTEFSKKYYRKFTLLVLFEKFTSILSDIEKLESSKNGYLKLFNDTEAVINEFFSPKKTFSFNSRGAFKVEANGRNIDIYNLSSGEKHLIALLGRVSLLSSDASVFVADEPELSLHLEWQRLLISSMRRLAPYLQIIVATHSPAIIPSNSNQIDLEESRR